MNTSTHLCCSGVVHRSRPGATCCGQQLQDANTRCCRSETTAQLYDDTHRCCGGLSLAAAADAAMIVIYSLAHAEGPKRILAASGTAD